MKVSGVTMVILVLNMLIGIAIPLGLATFFRKKYRCPLVPFWAGCGVMFLSAFVLEQIVHTVVLSSPAGNLIRENFWLMALYGGVMAGLFEETGRLLGMKFLLKKYHDNEDNALMYGAGHGGFEAFYLLFFTMLNNLIYAVLINSGQAEALVNGLSGSTGEALQAAFESLATLSPAVFLLSPVERLAAVLAQLALSVIVWQAAKEGGHIGWYFLAILLHFLLDAAAAILNGLGVPAVGIEVVVWIIAICYGLLAVKIRKNNRKQENN